MTPERIAEIREMDLILNTETPYGDRWFVEADDIRDELLDEIERLQIDAAKTKRTKKISIRT